MKPTIPDQVPPAQYLETELFACRRYYEVDNRRNDTVERRQKRDWIIVRVIGMLAIVFTPITIALYVYMSQNYAPREPLPWQLGVSMYCVTLISVPSCMITISILVLPKPCFGRWIIVHAGIFHRYGKSPHRFVPFSSLRSVRVERPKSQFAVIVFETDHEPLRISERNFSSNKPKPNDGDFLPFLNFLIDRLQRNDWNETAMAPLLDRQRMYQERRVWRRYLRYTQWLTMTCYFLPLFCILPFYRYLCMVPYPAIKWVVVLCCLVVALIGLALSSRCERWTNKKVTEKLRAIKQEYH